MFSRENLNWMNEAPKMSYNAAIGRPVFLNKEAFYVCLSGSSDPEIFNQVQFEIDESFESFFKESTGETEAKPELVSQFINGMVNSANENYQTFKEDEGVDVFTVPPTNPNTDNDDDIRWLNTESMDKANKKYNEKVRTRIFGERIKNPEEQLSELAEEIDKDSKTFTEYKEKSKKNT